MKEQSIRIGVIVGTTRPNRFSEFPAAWITHLLTQRENVETEVLDLRDYPMPFYNEPSSPSAITPKDYSDSITKKWAAKIAEMDGFIIVTGEYNHGYPAVLKNALDYVYHAWNGKAVGFVSYGSVSGARSVEQLRQVAIELQMAPIRSGIHLPWNVTEETRKDASALNAFDTTANAYLDQLLWWTRTLKKARAEMEEATPARG